MNSLWNKWIIDTIYRVNSRVNLNKAGASSMEQKCHRRYYINIPVSWYLSLNWKERLAIDKAGSQPMEQKRYWQVLSIFQITIPQIFQISWYPNVNSSLAPQTKCDNMFLDPESDNIFSHFLGTYLVYILFILICGNYPLTSKRGRCRNLLSIGSLLNQIDPSTNIFPLNPERGYRAKFEILLEGVFQYSIE